ncbi:unnamed protein product [Phaedon cochleariae]|uniref:G-patch domain-containing protein n=1 Tax=Phaedon cochleariae TaxID=80249 RepID=A0A9P0GMX6_PHACE|nr:unnamed protein product [Phaedon cochleariae]
MSMLAERKRKQKWSLNPRGKEWSQDTNKFGQKLLEKMGWQNGKGLGAKEDGITEHIKVSHKMDSKGMGYKETNDQWTEHESNFTALLSALSGDKTKEPEEIQLNSLEKKSQNSRARVHYHKFTRGKDLSRYSEKDLANIFGKKSLKSETKQDSIEETEKADIESRDSGSYFSGGSMRDYFKKKLPNFGKINDFIVGNNGVLKKAEQDSESESEIKPSFGFGFKSDDTNSSSATTNQTSFISYIQEDKKRKAEESNQEVFSPTKKHKKDKKQKNIDNMGLSNPAFDPLASPTKRTQNHVIDPIEESLNENIANSYQCPESVEMSENCQEELTKKKKGKEEINDISPKKKRKNHTIEHDVIKIEDQDIQTITEVQNKSKKKRKKQMEIDLTEDLNEACLKNERIIDPKSFESRSVDIIDITNETKTSKKKKKKKEKLLYDNPSYQVQNISIEESSTNIVENPYEVKPSDKKHKKKKKLIDNADDNHRISKIKKPQQTFEVENAGFSDSENMSEISSPKENPYEVEVKGKKKKNCKKLAIENPNFDDTEDSSTTNPIIEENPYEVKPKKEKKKKSKTGAVENPCFNDSMDLSSTTIENPYEVKTKKSKESKRKVVSTQQETPNQEKEIEGIVNPVMNLETNNDSIILEECDLMLNIVSTPIINPNKTPNTNSVTRVKNLSSRKSVRFSNITQELIIPNNDDLREMYNNEDSEPKNLNSISKTLDNYQAEMENDINEEKIKTVSMEDIMVGEVGNPHGENEKLSEGTKLKFKYAHFNAKTPFYQLDKVGAKKSYKHLIKGDIMVKFKNTNLHEIEGYAVNTKSAA